MSNNFSAFGLKPVRSSGFEKNRETIAAVAQELRLYDPVVRNADGNIIRATAGTGNKIYGTIVSIFDDSGMPKNYYPSMTVPPTGWTAVVNADTDQEFVMVEDSVGGSLALADRGQNANIIFGTVQFSGLSGCMIDSSSAASTAGHQLRLMRPLDMMNNTVGSANCQWIVKINNPQNAAQNLGAAV